MTITDYAVGLNGRIYEYLRSKVKHYQIDPFILKFSLAVEPLKAILNTPLVIQDGPKSFKKQELMQDNINKNYLKFINQFLDELRLDNEK